MCFGLRGGTALFEEKMAAFFVASSFLYERSSESKEPIVKIAGEKRRERLGGVEGGVGEASEGSFYA